MKQKLISVCLVMALVLSLCSGFTISVNADSIELPKISGNATHSVPDGLEYSISDNQVTITGYKSDAETVVIPATINGYPVTEISNLAFYDCPSLRNVTLPDTLIKIGRSAFSYSGVTHITIPDSVTSIGDYAFTSCYKLESATLGDGIKKIVTGLFYYCSNLTDVTFSEDISIIESDAFGKSGLISIVIPDSVTSIGSGAFASCTNLASVTMSNNITSLGDNAFYNCSSLQSIILPDGITSFESGTFQNCSNLKYITLGDYINQIPYTCFSGCTSLQAISFGASIQEIEDRIFYGRDLSELIIYFRGTEAQWANIDKSSLWDYTIAEGWNLLPIPYTLQCSDYYSKGLRYTLSEDSSFYIVDGLGNCTDSEISIPEIHNCLPVKEISESAFQNVTSLSLLTIPDSITKIGASAFENCNHIESICFIGTSEQWEAIDKADDWNAGTAFEIFYLGDYSQGLQMTLSEDSSYYIVTGIGSYTGRRIVIPPVHNGKYVREIASGAFADNDNILIILIPDSIQIIRQNAITGCRNLRSEEDNGAYYLGSKENPYLVLWKADSSVKTCSVHPDTKLIAGGAFAECKQLSGVTMPQGLIGIGDNAFAYCSSLKSVTIPENVRYMGSNIFSLCQNLTIAVLEDGIITIPNGTFEFCSNLKTVTLPNSLTSIGDSAFYCCYALSDITIPESVTYLGDSAFTCCSFNSINIPIGITSIANMTFAYCSQLSEIVIPQGVTTIGYRAFISCTNLTSVTIPDGVITIGGHAFDYCNNLKQITIPNSTQTIGLNAFYDCASLKTVYYYGTEDEWYEVDVKLGNDWLNNANVIFLCNHQYDHNCDASCNKCGDIREISHTFHNWQIANNAFHSRTCYICQKTESAPHRWDKGTIIQFPTETASGYIRYACQDCQYTYDKKVDYIPGDIDGNTVIDNKDVEYLLWHTLFPNDYPIIIHADYDRNGTVDNRDVEYLLWHTLFPNDYPVF